MRSENETVSGITISQCGSISVPQSRWLAPGGAGGGPDGHGGGERCGSDESVRGDPSDEIEDAQAPADARSLDLETADSVASLADLLCVFSEMKSEGSIDRNALDELLIWYGIERLSTCPRSGRGLTRVRERTPRSAGRVRLDSTARR
jgi:hypothetical protein